MLDFNNTEIAFAHLNDKELKKTAWLFGMMNRPWLVNNGSKLGLFAIQWGLPFAETAVKNTIFQQFCGGTSLLESQKMIDRLQKHQTLTVLDYGAEAKETELDFNGTMNEAIRAIDFASRSGCIPVVSTKITGMARFGLLEKIDAQQTLSKEEETEFQNVMKRVDAICYAAREKNIALYIDAEESWIQDAIDNIVNKMMARYNKEKVIVYNTFQMYRHDRLIFLKESYEKACNEGYKLGAKLVRGAYMEKERKRAEEMGYPSPINPNKAATDTLFNDALRFCISNYQSMACCNATHNAESNLLLTKLMAENNIPKNHPNIMFCQLLGMSDILTFNLASEGYNVGKYLVYGPVKEVIPYLIRRAQENTSVTGDMSREYKLIMTEMKRRGLS